jgi:hypothetical protein
MSIFSFVISTFNVQNDTSRRSTKTMNAVTSKFEPELTDGGSARAIIWVHEKSPKTATVAKIVKYPICVCL